MASVPPLVSNLFWGMVVLHSIYEATATDEIQLLPNSLPLRTSTSHRPSKRQTQTTTAGFLPIRIHVHYENETDVSRENAEMVRDAVQEAVLRIRSLLSVLPVEGQLLLQRKEACGEIHTTGINIRKCLRLKSGYIGEFCQNQLDKFKIPEEHLRGLDLYSNSSPSPLASSLPDGEGVASDFILYVHAKQSTWCLRQLRNLIAYSSHCRVDQNSRPTAGFVNFCPSSFLPPAKYTKPYFVQVAIHEIFHVLGFSSDLYSKYKDCQQFGNGQRECYSQRNPVRPDEEKGGYRIHLPSVMAEASRHFACPQDIGIPLQSSESGPSSHWDPLVMHGSIMAPTLKEPEKVWIDRITLSLFADTGWYQVNYTAADDYPWAKGAGCNFLLSPNCSNFPFLCNRSQINEMGCAMSSDGMAECRSVGDRHQCGIWQKNDGICCSNCARSQEGNVSLPVNALNTGLQDLKEEDQSPLEVRIPVVVNRLDKTKSVQHNRNVIKSLVLSRLLNGVSFPRPWTLKSSLTPEHGNNGSYSFVLWIERDANSSREELNAVMGRLQQFLASSGGKMTLDTSDLKSAIVSGSPVDEKSRGASFLKGWEAIVVLGGILAASLVLALILASFIQIKGKIRHTIMTLPQRIR